MKIELTITIITTKSSLNFDILDKPKVYKEYFKIFALITGAPIL